MQNFPRTINPLKTDPFREMQYCLKLWAQNEKLFYFYVGIFAYALLIVTSRTMYVVRCVKALEELIEMVTTYLVPVLVKQQDNFNSKTLKANLFKALVKLGVLLRNRRRFRFLFDKRNFWDYGCIEDFQVQQSLKFRFKFVNCLVISHTVMCSLYVVFHIVAAELPIPEGRTRWLPIILDIPFNIDNSPIYEFSFVLLTLNMYLSVYASQFILLRKLLESLDLGLMENSSDLQKFKSNDFQNEIFNRITICVQHHNGLIKYGFALINLFSYVLGIQLLLTLLSLVLTGYRLLENPLFETSQLLSFGISAAMQFAIFAFQSSDLYEQSVAVTNAAYQCNWYLLNSKSKKALTFLIMNSQKGITVTGAGLVQLGNELVVSMFHKVFSCITLLRSFSVK